MKAMNWVGILLIVAGVFALAYQGFTYTTREKAIDLGPLQVTTDRTHTVPLPPLVGAAAIVGGAVLVAAGNRKQWLGM